MIASNAHRRLPFYLAKFTAFAVLTSAPAAVAQPYVPESSVGQPNGVAGLDANSGTTFGSSTLVPTVRLLGPEASQGRGLVWQAPGSTPTTRFSLQTDGSDNLGLDAYDDTGNYLGNPIFVGRNAGTVNLTGALTLSSSAAFAQGAAGILLAARNTSATNSGVGTNFQYFSAADAATVAGLFDIGQQSTAAFNPSAYMPNTVTGSPGAIGGPGLYEGFRVAISPNDQTHNWGIGVEEWDVVNRGPDMGWFTDRGENNGKPPVSGGMVMVAFASNFGDPGGGQGTDALYGFTVARSPDTTRQRAIT